MKGVLAELSRWLDEVKKSGREAAREDSAEVLNENIVALAGIAVKVDQMRREWQIAHAEKVCPFRPGDVIEIQRWSGGRVDRYRVDKIQSQYGRPAAQATRILKSGADGAKGRIDSHNLRDAKLITPGDSKKEKEENGETASKEA